MSGVVTVPEPLDGHTVLDIECPDRIYLNGYVSALQVGGQVVTFLHDHCGMPIASRRCSSRSAPASASQWPGSPRTTSTEDWQDPVTSRARQREQAEALVRAHGHIVAEFFDEGESRSVAWGRLRRPLRWSPSWRTRAGNGTRS
jgi:hypothetical protein